MTALIFTSGKIVVTVAKSEDDLRLACCMHPVLVSCDMSLSPVLSPDVPSPRIAAPLVILGRVEC